MEVSGQLHAPATLPPEKESPVPIQLEAGWVTASLDTGVKKRKKSQPLLGTRILISYIILKSPLSPKI
jgi:hypothetical protein